MRVEWGIQNRKVLTGAHLCVRAFQVISMAPLPYIFAVAGYPAVITGRNPLSYLFDLGIMALPRLEAVALSLLYRLTASELVVYFALLAPAIVVGIVLGRLLRGTEQVNVAVRRVLAGLIAADLVIRLLPFGFNLAFGIPAAIVGWLIQLACLALVLLDLRAATASR